MKFSFSHEMDYDLMEFEPQIEESFKDWTVLRVFWNILMLLNEPLWISIT
jgi:hypothetical protein